MKQKIKKIYVPQNLKYTLQSGYTLVEVMVVISIITLLSSTAMSGFVTAKRAARDAVLKREIKTLSTALEAYRGENGDFPAVALENNVASAGLEMCNPTCQGQQFMSTLISSGILPASINPPKGNPSGFWYVHRVTGKISASQIFNTCVIGTACGFSPGTPDFMSCFNNNGNPPADTPYKAALFFWLENGPSKDFSPGGMLGGNVICFY